jgi:hypothetical protein
MNLAPCPDCGNSCSLLAQTCPKCGRPFEAGELERIASMSEPPKPVQSSSIVVNASAPMPAANNNAATIGCVVVAVLFILLALVCMSGGSNSRANCEQERLEENQRRYDRAQRDPNYNPEYVGPCE